MQPSLSTRRGRVDVTLWVSTFVSGGLTLYWSYGPVPAGSGAFPGADKGMHALAYLLTSFLFFLAALWRPGRGEGPLYAYRWVLVMAVAITGGMVEIGQEIFTTDRHAEFMDWAAEIAAVLLAYGAVMWMRRR